MIPAPEDGARPRMSVLIAVYNGAATLQRALDSVFEQSYPAVELIVMDGASTDGTPAILERNASRIAHWESEPDRGIYHAWNKALDHVRGEWVCFLGADDRYAGPDVFERVAGHLAEDAGGHRVVYGYLDKVLADGSVRRTPGGAWDDARRRRFAQGRMIPHPATFHHRSLFERHGRFDESYRIAGDFEFLLRELVDHDALFIPVVVVEFAAGGLSDRPGSRSLVAREVYRARYAHGLVASPPWRSRSLYRQLASIWFRTSVRPRLARLRRIALRRRTPPSM